MASENEITICAIARNEGRYIREWIAYHLAIGVSRIVVYSNEPTDDQEEVLQAASERDPRITWGPWPSVSGVSPQVSAYREAISRVTTPWVSFIDIDEFIVPLEDTSISVWLATVPSDVNSVHLNWRGFGSSGLENSDYGLVTDAFVMASPRQWGNNHHFKSVARTQHVKDVAIHNIMTTGKRVLSDFQEFETINNGLSNRICHHRIQINHYQSKTYDEFSARMRRGDANMPDDHPEKSRDGSRERFSALDLNDEEDRAISKFFARRDAELERLFTKLEA